MSAASGVSGRGLKSRLTLCRPLLTPIWLLASSVLFLLIAVLNMPFRDPRGKLILVAAQLLLLLPPAVALCRRRRIPSPDASRARWRCPVWVPFIVYLALTVPVSLRLGTAIDMADESTYLFQARLIQNGEFFTLAPPFLHTRPPQSKYLFENNVVSGDRWYGMYPPGWPVCLALWDRIFRSPWILNPLLGLVILLLVRRIAATTLGEDVSDATVWILVASPMFTLNCIGYWSEPLTAALLAGAVVLFLRAQQFSSVKSYLLMSGLVCLAFFVRPFESAAFGAVLAASAIWNLRIYKARAWWFIAGSSAMGAAAGGLLLLYNRATTGSLWKFGYAALEGTEIPNEIGIAPARLLHNLTHGTSLFLATTAQSSFPLLFVLAAYGFVLARQKRTIRMFAALFAAVVAAHVAGPETAGCMIGARYYFVSFAFLCILGGLGWTRLRPALANSRIPNVAVVSAVLVVIASFAYLANYGVVVRLPYARIDALIHRVGTRASVIFVGDTASRYGPAPALSARFVNTNGADWMNSSTLSFPDPGSELRPEFCHALGRREWQLARYDEDSGRASIIASGTCSGTAAGEPK